MKRAIQVVLVFFLTALLAMQATAQVKKDSKGAVKKDETQKPPAPPQPPPPPEEWKEVRIDTLSGPPSFREDPALLAPVNFDTTAAPDDELTHNIVKLLDMTHAIKMGTEVAGNIPVAENGDANMKAFYARFIEDMRTGTLRRWMERAYVREYRKRFTNDEVLELIRFYDTPVGRKLVSQTLDMLPEVMEQGKRMGMYRGMALYMEIMEEKKNN